MSTVLVVLTSDEADDRLLTAAERYAAGSDAEILMARFVDEKQHQSEVQREARSGKQTTTVDELESAAEAEAAGIAEAAFGGDVRYTALGVVGNVPDVILQVAEERDCEHVFVTGKRRSPSGKMLFGDVAQSVVLGFDGPVTVTTRS